jgi:hypothetical protein
MEILQTIAILCQLNGVGAESFNTTAYVERKQLQCQQHYVKCLGVEINSNYKTLSKCILERKL